MTGKERILGRPARIVLTVSLALFSASTVHAQQETLKFNTNRITTGRIIHEIEHQTRYVFVFDNKVFDTARLIQVEPEIRTLHQVLEQMTCETDFSYEFRNRFILLSRNKMTEKTIETAAEPPRTNDIYRQTGIHTVSAKPLKRPEEPKAFEEPAVALPEPAQVELPAPYSRYVPVDRNATLYRKHPTWALKTNLLHTAAALAPNLAVEFGIGPKSTLEFSFGANLWKQKASLDHSDKLHHWIARPEYRYWFCERFTGHFIGGHVFYAKYNISEHDIPLLFDKEYRYEGTAMGAGFTYGYHLALGKRWGAEFNLGVGFAQLKYDRYDCQLCAKNEEAMSKTYFGLTRAGITLVFLIK